MAISRLFVTGENVQAITRLNLIMSIIVLRILIRIFIKKSPRKTMTIINIVYIVLYTIVKK